jgi:hypothetical protein
MASISRKYNRVEPCTPCRLQEADTVALAGGGADDLCLPSPHQRIERTPQEWFGELAEFCCQLLLRLEAVEPASGYDDRVCGRDDEALL